MTHFWMDRLGGVASAACALHCLAFAMAPAVIAALGLGVLASEAFEWGFFTVAMIFAFSAAFLGYRVHRTAWVVAGFGVGMMVLLGGRLGEAFGWYEGGAVVATLGGLVLVASHLASLRRLRACSEADCS